MERERDVCVERVPLSLPLESSSLRRGPLLLLLRFSLGLLLLLSWSLPSRDQFRLGPPAGERKDRNVS